MIVPAETFPPGEFLADELIARQWTTIDLARRMGGDVGLNKFIVDMLILAPAKGMLIGRETAEQLGQALGTPADFWLNLDAAWQASP
jgi:HTH-type transcriptional regulator / antitoxin HigA